MSPGKRRDEPDDESGADAGAEGNGDMLHDEDAREEEFPEGEGTAQTEATVMCPYCGEAIEIALDPGGGDVQEYVEDCQVCCQPWQVVVTYAPDGSADVWVERAD